MNKYAQKLILTPTWKTVDNRKMLVRVFYRLVKLYMHLLTRRRISRGQPTGPGMFGECPTGPTGTKGPCGGPIGPKLASFIPEWVYCEKDRTDECDNCEHRFVCWTSRRWNEEPGPSGPTGSTGWSS